MNVENLKSEFDALFENNSETLRHYSQRGYWITKETKDNSVMYIGLNPSYPHKDYEMSEKIFYNENEQSIHSYFKQIEQLHNNLKYDISWTHFDLLILRETQQSEVKKICLKPDVREFIKRNLALSKLVIENSKPKIIVVANTMSKELLKSPEWSGYSFDWDDEIGTYRFAKETALSGTPVFFSSMISGQRALDIGSRERLIWQIRRTLELIDKNNKA